MKHKIYLLILSCLSIASIQAQKTERTIAKSDEVNIGYEGSTVNLKPLPIGCYSFVEKVYQINNNEWFYSGKIIPCKIQSATIKPTITTTKPTKTTPKTNQNSNPRKLKIKTTRKNITKSKTIDWERFDKFIMEYDSLREDEQKRQFCPQCGRTKDTTINFILPQQTM